MTKLIVQKHFKKTPALRNPLLIEGLPGIGHVGKIALDFLVEELKPELLYKIYAYSFGHAVYFNDENCISLPSVSIYRHKGKKRDILLLTGDVQPADETASYEFCDKILDFVEELGCRELITLGGIGMPHEVKTPAVFGAFNDKSMLKRFKRYKGINVQTADKIGAIVGVSGLLLGLAQLRNIKGVSLLSETYAHQDHLGFREAKVLLEKLQTILELKLKLVDLEKEITENETHQRTLIKEDKKFSKKHLKPLVDKIDLKYIG